MFCVLFGNFTKGLLWQQKLDFIWTHSSSRKLLQFQLKIQSYRGEINSLKGKLRRFVGTAAVERYKSGEEMKSEQYHLISFLFSMVVMFYSTNKHTHIAAEPCQSSPHSCVYIAQPQPGQTNTWSCNSLCLHENRGEIQ